MTFIKKLFYCYWILAAIQQISKVYYLKSSSLMDFHFPTLKNYEFLKTIQKAYKVYFLFKKFQLIWKNH